MNKLFVRSENWGSAALLAIPVAIAALLVCGGSGSFVWVAALTIVAISIALDASDQSCRQLRYDVGITRVHCVAR